LGRKVGSLSRNLKPARRAASRRAVQWPTLWPTTDELIVSRNKFNRTLTPATGDEAAPYRYDRQGI